MLSIIATPALSPTSHQADEQIMAASLELADLRAKWREHDHLRTVLMNKYDSTLPAMPHELRVQKQDRLLFTDPVARLPRDNYAQCITAIEAARAADYRYCTAAPSGKSIEWKQDPHCKARAEEIFEAHERWLRVQNDHSNEIGLMAKCDELDAILADIDRLVACLSELRASTVDGLAAKAMAARDQVQTEDCEAIRDSIIRDLISIFDQPVSPSGLSHISAAA